MRSLLTIGKYSILEASDAESGIQLARKNRPQLILMDIQLPGMDGLDATRLIKIDPDLKKIPIIAVASRAMDDDRKAIEAGCDGYISKPIDTRGFLITIDQYLSQVQSSI